QPYPVALGYPPTGNPYGPYGAYPARPPVSGLAIAAFVLGVLCFVPAVGLVLGLVALAQIRKRVSIGALGRTAGR
ncbi:DUF4190 domain-containing protein, partial [Streptomyces rochei]|uniref:DUF4190 domain-containing protein n=1 Tax=Streptomyces rochei TaxID=1928 RepID=UPI0033A03A93